MLGIGRGAALQAALQSHSTLGISTTTPTPGDNKVSQEKQRYQKGYSDQQKSGATPKRQEKGYGDQQMSGVTASPRKGGGVSRHAKQEKSARSWQHKPYAGGEPG